MNAFIQRLLILLVAFVPAQNAAAGLWNDIKTSAQEAGDSIAQECKNAGSVLEHASDEVSNSVREQFRNLGAAFAGAFQKFAQIITRAIAAVELGIAWVRGEIDNLTDDIAKIPEIKVPDVLGEMSKGFSKLGSIKIPPIKIDSLKTTPNMKPLKDLEKKLDGIGTTIGAAGAKAGGDLARESKKAGGTFAEAGKKAGGDIATAGKKAGADFAREGKKALDDTWEEGKRAGKWLGCVTGMRNCVDPDDCENQHHDVDKLECYERKNNALEEEYNQHTGRFRKDINAKVARVTDRKKQAEQLRTGGVK